MPAAKEDIQTALSLLPHGPEFRFVDRLLSLDRGKEGVGEYRVRGDEPFLRGHLPGEPLMPGVIMLEAAAQMAGVAAQSDLQIPALPGLKLTAVRAVKILGAARPGDVLRIEAKVTRRMGHLIQAESRVLTKGEVILTAELTLSGTIDGGREPDWLAGGVSV